MGSGDFTFRFFLHRINIIYILYIYICSVYMSIMNDLVLKTCSMRFHRTTPVDSGWSPSTTLFGFLGTAAGFFRLERPSFWISTKSQCSNEPNVGESIFSTYFHIYIYTYIHIYTYIIYIYIDIQKMD